MRAIVLLILATTVLIASVCRWTGASARDHASSASGNPEALIDLATDSGAKLVKGQWRYSDTRIIEVDFKSPGPDRQPSGAPVKTYDYVPHAGGADFDDSGWQAISATSLDERRGTGRICFNWYRIKLTIPERIGDYDPAGSTVVFETALDDYPINPSDQGDYSRRRRENLERTAGVSARPIIVRVTNDPALLIKGIRRLS